MIKVLVGTNWFGLKAELDNMVREFVKAHTELGLERIDASEVSFEQVVGAVESLPFLTSRKMVVVFGLSSTPSPADDAEILFRKLNDTTDLIIVEPKVDKRGSYYKLLKQQAGFCEYNELDQAALVAWVQGTVTEKSGKITASNARYLVERVGLNQTKVALEIDKLVAYSPEISRQTIENLTEETPTATIFNLIDNAFSGRIDRAIEIYASQRAQKVEPQAIFAMLVWQMHIVSLVARAPKDARAEGIAKDAGLNPYVVQKSQSIAKKMGVQKVSDTLHLLRDIDVNSKTKTINFDDALRFFIVSLTK